MITSPKLPPKDGYVEIETPDGERIYSPTPETLAHQHEQQAQAAAAYVSRMLMHERLPQASDNDIIATAAIMDYPQWADLAGRVAKADCPVLWHKEQLYAVVSDFDWQAHQEPGGEGMLAIFRPIVPQAAGTIDDPIPFVFGMDVWLGKYYTQDGGLWRAKKDMLPCVWPPAAGNEWEAV